VAGLIAFAPVSEEDFDRLLDLRMRVMRVHLERIGRFDPVRARARFRNGFVPDHMRLILVDGAFAGCVSLVPDATGFELMHFYVEPALQGHGVGGEVLRRLCVGADALGKPIHLGVLKQSPARRFYERHGFVLTHDDQWDDFLRRPVLGSSDRNRPGE
jgi:GNAT superfamily N-acetyltransferase